MISQRLVLIACLLLTITACNSGGSSSTDGGTNPETNTDAGASTGGLTTGSDGTGTTGSDGTSSAGTTTNSDGGSSTGGDTGGTDGDASTDSGVEECSIADVNQWVDDGMRDFYFYYDQVPTVDLAQYDDPNTLIRDLRVPPDRFSYVTDTAQQDALFDEGITFGYGFRFVRTNEGVVRTAAVNSESPADTAGLLRGDILVAVNGISIDEITNEQWAEALGTPPEVRSPIFSVQGEDGLDREVQITSGEYRLLTVQSGRFFDTNAGTRVGYVHFLSYLGTAQAELNSVMAWLIENEVDELVLDLRFNGGGFTSIARQIGSQVAGEPVFDQVAEQLSFNDRYAEFNYTRDFDPNDFTLDLSRLFVITSDRTASASELTINALRPYIEVFTVGNRTVGKPFASRGRDRCGKRMQAIELLSTNANGASVIDGIPADCEVFDNYRGTQGSLEDSMMSTALNYMLNGSCEPLPSTTPQAAVRRAGAAETFLATPDVIGEGSIAD